MLDKQMLEKMYVHSLKVKKVLFILSMIFFAVATASFATFLSLRLSGYDVILIPDYVEDLYLSNVFLDFFELFLAGGIVCIMFSFLIYGRRAIMAKNMLENFDKIKNEQERFYNTKPSGAPIVDAKPVEEPQGGKYANLIKEYRKLYEQGVITKEEFEQKEKELTK